MRENCWKWLPQQKDRSKYRLFCLVFSTLSVFLDNIIRSSPGHDPSSLMSVLTTEKWSPVVRQPAQLLASCHISFFRLNFDIHVMFDSIFFDLFSVSPSGWRKNIGWSIIHASLDPRPLSLRSARPLRDGRRSGADEGLGSRLNSCRLACFSLLEKKKSDFVNLLAWSGGKSEWLLSGEFELVPLAQAYRQLEHCLTPIWAFLK